MRFIPRKPRDDVNVSPTHPLVEAGTLVVGVGLIFLVIMLALGGAKPVQARLSELGAE